MIIIHKNEDERDEPRFRAMWYHVLSTLALLCTGSVAIIYYVVYGGTL